MSEIGSQSPSAFNESSYDDSSVFDRDDSLRENGTLSGDTRHQFSVQKRPNAHFQLFFVCIWYKYHNDVFEIQNDIIIAFVKF